MGSEMCIRDRCGHELRTPASAGTQTPHQSFLPRNIHPRKVRVGESSCKSPFFIDGISRRATARAYLHTCLLLEQGFPRPRTDRSREPDDGDTPGQSLL